MNYIAWNLHENYVNIYLDPESKEPDVTVKFAVYSLLWGEEVRFSHMECRTPGRDQEDLHLIIQVLPEIARDIKAVYKAY